MTNRRYDLDWLRIIAFGVLILYHIGMFYVNWSWHVNSSRSSGAIAPLMTLSNPWRLTLLFMISGAATRFLADKLSVWRFTEARMGRLWPPLLLGIFVIVPPQAYYQMVEIMQAMGPEDAAQYASSFDNFYLRYLAAPAYNHMWFVAFLIVYSLALVPLLPLLRRIPKAIAALIEGPFLLITPWLAMVALRFTLFPAFGESHTTPWYLHTLYFGMFLFGFAIAKYEPFFEGCMRFRWPALALALAGWASVLLVFPGYMINEPPRSAVLMSMQAAYCLQAWCSIVAAFGFAHRYLRNADGPVRRLLTQAVFPFYIVHQTIIVVAGHYLDELRWPLVIEAPLLIAITVAGCWVFFDLGRRIPWLRPWIGLASNQPRFRASGAAHGAEEAQ
jgi:peptidoglycan/LPS O-acetylase OafA/YrhL